MFRSALLATALAVAGCASQYSPDTYSAKAVQQAAKVDQAVIIGVRQVDISADTTLGAATGGAAGGLVGSQVGDARRSARSAGP
jgi:outer membrane lipoprotein SlyB